MTKEKIIEKIKESLPSAIVTATDLTGTGDHWRVNVQAKEFTDLSLVAQHQLIYKALGQWMKKEIHALSIETSVL